MRLKKTFFGIASKVLLFLTIMSFGPLSDNDPVFNPGINPYLGFIHRSAESLFGSAMVYAATPVAAAGDDISIQKSKCNAATVQLNGGASSDPDGDAMNYHWYGPFAVTSGLNTSVDIPEGSYTVSLIVDDGSSLSNPDTVTITVNPFFNISARCKPGKVQLTWTHIAGTERYDIYRSTESDPSNFVKIAETTSTYSTYLDEPVTNEVTYLYVVGAVSQGAWRYSNVVSSHPTALRVISNYAPVIYSSTVMNGTVGVIYNYDVNATDPNGNALTYSLSSSPSGMTIDPATGLIAWVPQAEGTYDVTVDVQDGNGGTDNQSFSITVEGISTENHPPVITSSPVISTIEGSAYVYDLVAQDQDNDALVFTLFQGPAGIALDAASGRLSWLTPVVGSYNIIVIVGDGRGGTDSQSYALVVTEISNRAPIANAGGPYSGLAGQSIVFDGSGSTDPDNDPLNFSWDFGGGSTATGINPGHTYGAAGDYTVTLTVTDPEGASNASQVPATITDINHPPALQAVGNRSVREGETLSFQIIASDPDNNLLVYRHSQLPVGAGFEASDDPNIYTFSWTPGFDQAGQYQVSFVVSDPDGLSDSADVVIVVENTNRAPFIDSVPEKSVKENNDLTFYLTGGDPDQDQIAFGGADLPAGATIASDTGLFSWRPTFDQSGQYHLTISVSDESLSTQDEVTIEVIDVNRPPVIVTTQLPNGRVDQVYHAKITASDPDGDQLIYTITNATANFTISGIGEMSWDRPGINDIGDYALTVQADDSRGGIASRDYSIIVPDTIAPSVFLAVPKSANPGTTFSAVATASDNDAVIAITIDGNRIELSVPYPKAASEQAQISLPNEIGPYTVRASASDRSGNTCETTKIVEIVASFDTETPSVKLNAPIQVAQGQTIPLATSVSDNVGVSSVTFSADGMDIQTVSAQNPAIVYQIPLDAVIGSTISFRATVIDYSGNSAFDEVLSTVVGPDQTDTASPEASMDAPGTVTEDLAIPLSVETANEDCLSRIDVYVNHSLAASYFAPDPGQFNVPLPEGVNAGMEALLEVIVTDCSGNQTMVGRWIVVEEPARGVIAGEVYDDSTGLPLEGAEVIFYSGDGSAISRTTDCRGQYSLVAKAGAGRLTIVKKGFTMVERIGLTVPSTTGLEVYDARPSPISVPCPIVSATVGGELRAIFSVVTAGLAPVLKEMAVEPDSVAAADIRLDIPGGALTQDQAFNLTQISPQGLRGILPGGWSPVGAADIRPYAIAFQVPANLTLPNPLALNVNDKVTLAMWNEAEKSWGIVSIADVSQDGKSISAAVPSTGQFVFLLPDDPSQVPQAPLPGEALHGVSLSLLPDSVTSSISPDPKIIFYRPGVHSDVGVNLSNGPSNIPSGVPLLVNIAEEYDFYSGDSMTLTPFVQDIFLYRFKRSTLSAAFPVTPSMTFEPLSLEEGVIKVDAIAPGDSDRGLGVVSSSGGAVSLSTGETISLPDGASTEFIPVELKSITKDTIGMELPAGLTFAGGVTVSFSGVELEIPAIFSAPVPADLSDQGHILLLRLEEIDGVTRFVFIGLGERQGDRIVSFYSIPGNNDIRLSGILSGGRYIFAQIASSIGFSHGTVVDTDTRPLENALVMVDDLPFVTLSGEAGAYILAVNTDMFSLVALDLVKRDSGSSTGFMPAADQLAELDIFLQAVPPYVVSSSPANGRENVPLDTAVKITFSEPVDPMTASAENIVLTGPEGPVPGTLTLSSNNCQLTYRPSAPLITDTSYTFSVSQAVKDMAGRQLESAFVIAVTTIDTTPPPPPAAGAITATIPGDTGRTIVTATQGTAGPHDTVTVINKTKGASTPALVEANGGFTVTVEAGIVDELLISIKDQAGNETAIPIGQFRNPDGSVAIGPLGGQIEADNGAILDIPQGAFPEGAIVRFRGLTMADIGIDPGERFPFVTGFEIECSVEPEIYLNASGPLPHGAGSGSSGIVARVVEVYGGIPALAIVDTAKVDNGRLSTSSPPCPGILQRVGRYAMFLNNDERMAMAHSLVSIVATGMHSVAIQALTGNSDENFEPLYDFVAVAGSPGGAVSQIFEQTCLPVPPDTPLTVVIRDAGTREALKVIDVDPIEPFKFAHFHASIYIGDTDDKISPKVIGVNPINLVLDGYNKRIQIRFSEPIDYMVLLGGGLKDVYLSLEGDEEKIYKGTWQLLENNTLLVFETFRQLPLGKKFRLHLENIKDLAGNAYSGCQVIISTFKPHVIFPKLSNRLSRNDIANGLGVDVQNIPQPLWFQDMDFVTNSPDKSFDGKWRTTLAAIQGGETNSGSYRLFTIDASDPTTPVFTGAFQTDGRFNQRKVRLLDNIDLIPREDSWADPEFWKDHSLYYSRKDTSVRMCFDPDDPDQEQYIQWIERHCNPDDGGCEVISGGCGDVAVTITDSAKYSYLWTYDVTNDNQIRWISSRRLSDNGTGYGSPRQYEAPAGMGTPFGLAVLPGMDITHGDMLHQNTVGAYVANYGIGLELADLGLNIPTINDEERQSADDYPWGHAESLKLNSQLYYRDVAVVPSKTVGNVVIPPKVVAIAGDISAGTGVRTMEIFRADLQGEPTGMKAITGLPEHVAVATDIPVWDADINQNVQYDFAVITTDSGVMIYEIPADGSSPEKSGYIIDTPAGVRPRNIEVDSRAMLAYVSATNVNEVTGGDGLLIVDISDPFAYAEDEDGDGWNDRIIGRIPLTIPGYAGPAALHGLRVDRERGLVYGGVAADGEQAMAIFKVRDCPDLSMDFTAIPEPGPAPEEAEKQALRQLINSAITASGIQSGVVSMLSYGDRSCLWKEGCTGQDNKDRSYRFAVIIPQSEWAKKDLLLVELYQQVIGADGGPRKINALGFNVTFEDIEFTPVKEEEYIAAAMGLEPMPDDPALARQTQLLEWVLDGAYVDGAGLSETNIPLEMIITQLPAQCDQGECVSEEPSHIWRQEGYELAKQQEAVFLKSGALIRFHGESEKDTTLHIAMQKDIKAAARAAIRAALARIISSEEGNSLMAFRVDTYKSFGLGIVTNNSLDPAAWEATASCVTFEHWIASLAARSVQENLGVFTIEEIVDTVYEFQKVADGEKKINTAEDANAFIARAWRFIQDVTGGFVWSVYQAKLMDDPKAAERASNMAAIEARIAELQQGGRREIIPRVVNKGPEDAKDIYIRMYDAAGGSTSAVTEITANIPAGAAIHPEKDSFVIENIHQTDTGVKGWKSFLADIPEKTLREADRDNNMVNLFFYVLDPLNPVVPELPPEPGLPVPDPEGDLLTGDPACLCHAPELNIGISSNGLDSISAKPGDCVDVDVRVVNIGNETLRDAKFYVTLPGMDDWAYDIAEISAGGEQIFSFQYCVPQDAKDGLEGLVWFEEMDDEYEPPPSTSNPLHIELPKSLLNVDAKANGKDEVFVGKGQDVTFTVAFDNAHCTNPRYFWDLGDVNGLFNEAGGTYSYNEGGTYKARVRVTCEEGWEEDVVDVHVVDLELMVNNTLDDPAQEGDPGQLDDVVRLKTFIPPGHPDGVTTRVFTAPCSIRLKKPLLKDAWVMLMSPGAKVGFADDGVINPPGESIRDVNLPKSGGAVKFAVTGELGSDSLNDAVIRVLLDDPGDPVAEEDLTVYWYGETHIAIDVHGVYSVSQATDDNNNIEPNILQLTCVQSAQSNTPFPEVAVFMKAKATLHPDFGACLTPEVIARTRIAVAQNWRDFEMVCEYHDPLVLWDPYAPQSVQSVDVNNAVRVTHSFPLAPPGQWIIDGGEDSKPLYDRNFDLSNPAAHTAIRPPLPCNDSSFAFTSNGVTYSDSGTWYNDTPFSKFSATWPPMDKPAIAIEQNGLVVAHVRYMKFGKVVKKETFRTWAVTFWKELPFDTSGGKEEIIPLREVEWWLDLDTSALDINGLPILAKHQAQTWADDIAPVNYPLLDGPFPEEAQVDASYFGGVTTYNR